MLFFFVCVDYVKNNYFSVYLDASEVFIIFVMGRYKLAFCWVVSGPWHQAASRPMMEGAWPWVQVGPGLPWEHVGPGLPREGAETVAAPSIPAAGVAGCTNSPCTNKPHAVATISQTTVTKLLKHFFLLGKLSAVSLRKKEKDLQSENISAAQLATLADNISVS